MDWRTTGNTPQIHAKKSTLCYCQKEGEIEIDRYIYIEREVSQCCHGACAFFLNALIMEKVAGEGVPSSRLILGCFESPLLKKHVCVFVSENGEMVVG